MGTSIVLHDANDVAVAEVPCTDTTELLWSRTLSETSVCQISTGPIPSVAERVRQNVHWASIIRDGAMAWRGPILRHRVMRGGSFITAHDPSFLHDRTRVPFTRAYTDADPARVAAELHDAAMDHHRVTRLVGRASVLPTGLSYALAVERDAEMVSDPISRAVDLGCEWTMLAGRAFFMPALRDPSTTLGSVALSDCDFLDEMEVVFDGSSLYTDVRVQGANFAHTATREVAGLRLQALQSINELTGEASIIAAARQAVDRSSSPRAAISVPAGARLSPDAGLSLDQMIPGLVIPVSTTLAGGVSEMLRIEKVEVRLDSSGETISVTLGESPVRSTVTESGTATTGSAQ